MDRKARRGRFALAGVLAALAFGAVASVGAALSPSGPGAAAKQYPKGKVTICHRTKSKKHPFVTIRVSMRALPAHLRHGDSLGTCAERARKLKKLKKLKAKKAEHAKAKPGKGKPAKAKPAKAKPDKAKPAKAKPAEAKPAEVKPAKVKPAKVKPAKAKKAEHAKVKPAKVKPDKGKGRSEKSERGQNKPPEVQHGKKK
jgi:hypothetical protein